MDTQIKNSFSSYFALPTLSYLFFIHELFNNGRGSHYSFTNIKKHRFQCISYKRQVHNSMGYWLGGDVFMFSKKHLVSSLGI